MSKIRIPDGISQGDLERALKLLSYRKKYEEKKKREKKRIELLARKAIEAGIKVDEKELG